MQIVGAEVERSKQTPLSRNVSGEFNSKFLIFHCRNYSAQNCTDVAWILLSIRAHYPQHGKQVSSKTIKNL